MKRSLFTQRLKQTLLAVPACALMLGAAQAGTTVGLNFQQWYYDSGNTPQTIGSCNGYSAYNATGLPVTAKAFGVGSASWFNTDPMGSQYNADPINQVCTFAGATTFAGGLSCNVNAPKGAHASGVGCPFASGITFPSYAPGVWTTPGENELYWGNILGDDGNPFSVSVTGLAAKFPSGYVIQSMAAHGGYSAQTNLPSVDFTDGTTTYTAAYQIKIVQNGLAAQWPYSTVGISDPSAVFTADTIYLNSRNDGTGLQSPLAGFIITDQPVVTQTAPASTVTTPGATFVLTSAAIGIGTLSYQWQHAGTNLTGANATLPNYTNSSATTTDSGSYQVLVTSSSFPSITATGSVLTVAVHAAVTSTWDTNTATAGAQDGSGTWSVAGTNWWTGSANDVFYPNDSAIFGAGGTGTYTVTLGDNVSANSITFSSGGYTITNTSGQTLTLSGSPTITATTNGTITVPVTVVNAFVKAGAGYLTLSGGLTSTNNNGVVTAGTLEILAGPNTPFVVTNGATYKIGYSTGGGYANSAVKIYGDGTAAITGFYIKGGTTYNVQNVPTLLGAPTTIRQYGTGLASMGTFDINGTGLSCTVPASGSIIDANIQMVNYGYGMSLTVAAGTSTTTGDLVINGPLNVNAGNGVYGLVKYGNGSLRLNGAATSTNCALSIRSGSALCGIDNCIGTNAFLDIRAGATIDLYGTSQTVSNATLAGILKMTINKGGSPNSSKLNSWSSAPSLGGTLVVTNVGGTLTLGDTFTLFPVAGSSGFTNLILPTLSNGLAWLNNSAVDGTIQVITGSVPPTIVTDLTGTTNYAYVGGSRTITITVTGDPTLRYTWLKNGVTPVGTDSPTLTLTALTLGSSGNYACTVTNNYAPPAYSQTDYLQVVTPSLATGTAIQDGPMSLWPLNETTAGTAYDYAAGHNGTQNGTLTLGATGPVPPTYAGFDAGTKAYQFDGTSAYVDCGTAPSLSGTTDFTVEAWINTTNAAGGSTIIQQRSPTGFNGEYILGLNSSGTAHFTIFGGGNTQYTLNTPVGARRVNDGKWHHVAAVRSGLNGYLYVDGSLVASATGTAIAPLDATIATYIGADVRSSTSYFNGQICNVAVYGTALSGTRVGEHAATGVLGTGPLKLNIVSGGWIEDSKPVGSPVDGQNFGTTWLATSTDGASLTRTGAVQFASGAQIAIPPNPAFNAATGTICFWMLTPTPPAGTGMMLVDRRTSAGMVIVLDGTPSGGIDVQYNGNPSFASGGNVIDGNWHHVAVTYDQTASGSVAVYIDGTLQTSQANTAAWSWPTTQQIELGRSHDTYWQEYGGQMDDYRIYNRALTATEIGIIGTAATSDTLVDTTALQLRYNFGTAGVGKGLAWPQIGVLYSSPVLGPTAVWSTNNTTTATYPFLPPYAVTNSALFYQLKQ